MTDNTEALPPLPKHTMDMHMIAIPMRCRDDARRYAENYARAALAQRQQVPAEVRKAAVASLLTIDQATWAREELNLIDVERVLRWVTALTAAPSAQAEPMAPNDRFPHCTTCNEEFFPFCARGDCPGSAALEKVAAQAEPVAWVEAEALQRVQKGVGSLLTASSNKRGFCDTPLYAAPPTAQAEPQGELCIVKNEAGQIVAVTRCDADGRILETIAESAQAEPQEPLTEAQLNSVCLSYRHDFGLMDAEEQERMRWAAKEWLRAFRAHGIGKQEGK